ncbi:MAG: hypothetical protein DSY42_02365 [Aquifex sp.]|nr:MAG: hypothetical protein DSY42_02365 [Aquifex sp.]
MKTKLSIQPKPNPPVPLPPDILFDLAKEYMKLQAIKEREKTKRKLIEAQLQIILESSQKYLEEYRKIVNKKFSEREKAFKEFLKSYRKASKRNDYKSVTIIGNLIIQLLKTPIITIEDVKGILPLLTRIDNPLPEVKDQEVIPAEIEL